MCQLNMALMNTLKEGAKQYCTIRIVSGAISAICIAVVILCVSILAPKNKDKPVPWYKRLIPIALALAMIAVAAISIHFRNNPFLCGATIASNTMSLFSSD
jgi:peptidoglycan/LPS O-acetylase OafA/YrhL